MIMMNMGFVVYKNGRKYSNVKFSSIDECKEFIDLNLNDSYMYTDNYDVFEYPSGKFVTRFVIEDTDKGLVLTENCPEKTPRNRRFIKKQKLWMQIED